jgi:hypothetical protein
VLLLIYNAYATRHEKIPTHANIDCVTAEAEPSEFESLKPGSITIGCPDADGVDVTDFVTDIEGERLAPTDGDGDVVLVDVGVFVGVRVGDVVLEGVLEFVGEFVGETDGVLVGVGVTVTGVKDDDGVVVGEGVDEGRGSI